MAGQTGSTDFPTVNAIQASNQDTNAKFTAFVACLNSTGSALAYSTYLGGTWQALANGIAVDSSGNAHVAGIDGGDFPTVNPIQASGGTTFVAALSPPPALTFLPTSLSFGTVVGGTTSPAQSVMVTPLSTASVGLTGITTSGDFALVTTATSCPYAGGTVAGGTTCTIDLTFSPTATGSRTGTVTISYTGTGSPQTVALSGNGIVSAANVSPTSLSFNSQLVGTASTPQTVTLTNTGSVAMSVSNVAISSGWTQTNNCLPSIAANAACAITVSFQPTAAGSQSGTLTITDNAGNSPQTVTLSGTGMAGASLSPTSLTFGSQAVGSSSANQTITLTNPANGGGTNVPGMSVSGDSQDFQINNPCDSLATLTANSPCPITVSFTPTTAGTRTAALTVTYVAASGAIVNPLGASLTGTGLAPLASLSAATLTFAGQSLGSASSPQAVTLSNTGNAALAISSITASGDFAATNTCKGSVAANSSCTINVTFTPTEAGTRTGTLTINDNSDDNYPPAGGGQQTVSLSGTGMDFGITSSTTSQTVSAGQTASYSVTLAPQAGFNQTVNLTCSGAPSESTCTFTPGTVTLNGTASTTVAVAVSTTAPSLAPPQGRFLPSGLTGLRGVFWLYALLWLASVTALAAARKPRAAWLLGAGLLLVVLWSACGGGGTTTPPPSNVGTTAGTYTLEVTATDASTSTLAHTIKLTLTVS